LKHKQLRLEHVLEHFDMLHECKQFLMRFLGKIFICNQESDESITYYVTGKDISQNNLFISDNFSNSFSFQKQNLLRQRILA